jgi:hypothetical protein
VPRESGGLQPVDRLLTPAVVETVENLELQPEDVALAKLAERYAREIDGASAAGAQADKVLREVGDDPELAELVGALKAKLGARSAMENLGPKLLAVLDALGATPKARTSAGKGGAPRGTHSKLAAIRASRAG